MILALITGIDLAIFIRKNYTLLRRRETIPLSKNVEPSEVLKAVNNVFVSEGWIEVSLNEKPLLADISMRGVSKYGQIPDGHVLSVKLVKEPHGLDVWVSNFDGLMYGGSFFEYKREAVLRVKALIFKEVNKL